MSQGDKKDSITTLRKWNLIAGGIDPKNDVIPASVGYGLEEGLQFAVSEITRLEAELERTKQERNAIAKNTREPLLLKLDEANIRIKRLEEAGDALAYNHNPFTFIDWTKAKEAKP